MDEIETEKQEIKKLKNVLELREEFFKLIITNTTESIVQAKKILESNKSIFSYFKKFSYLQQGRNNIKYYLLPEDGSGLNIRYNSNFEDIIQEDLNRIKKYILEREHLLQQRIFLEQQKELIETQKKDIEENKEYRKEMNKFTFVLAFGIVISLLFSIYQLMIDMTNADNSNSRFIAGGYLLFFAVLISFILYVFDMKKQSEEYFKKPERKWIILIIFLLIVGLFCLIIFIPNSKIVENQDESINLINQTNIELQKTNNLLNKSLNNQNEIDYKLDSIILNQINLNNLSK